MDRKVVLVVIGIIVLIGGAMTYVLLSQRQGSTADKVIPVVPAPTTPKSPPAPQAQNQPGAFVDYSEAAVASTMGTKLLFFHAPWCPQCRELEASIKNDGIPSGVTIFKVDYDSHQTLRQKYGVTIQTTFVKIDADGTKLASYVAYEEPQFSSVRRELLP
jgi:thiol-disulfide isomerase/thioredoxin